MLQCDSRTDLPPGWLRWAGAAGCAEFPAGGVQIKPSGNEKACGLCPREINGAGVWAGGAGAACSFRLAFPSNRGISARGLDRKSQKKGWERREPDGKAVPPKD